MEKKLIFQINVPNYSQKIKPSTYTYIKDMYHISERNARRYANKFKAEYYLLSDASDFRPAAGKHLDYQKLKIYDFLNYDQIIYMDCDYIIKDNAPNLFDLCKNQFSAALDQGKSVHKKAQELGIPTNSYFNAGIMHIPKWVIKKTKDRIEDYLKFEYSLQGQGLLNKLFYDHDIKINELNFVDWNPVKKTFGTYADHYSGKTKDRWGTVSY